METNISFYDIDGSVVYAFKGTAEEEKNPSQFLQDGNLNILKNEEFGWLLSPKRNNIIIQGSSGDQGETVPTSWVSDGTIEYDVVCYTQLNGSRLAYNLEYAFISHLMDNYPLGVICANRGHFRGNGGDETGVHVCGFIVLKNAKSLFQEKKFALSSRDVESRTEIIRTNMSKHPGIYQMVDPSPGKMAILDRKNEYLKSRVDVRRNRRSSENDTESESEE